MQREGKCHSKGTRVVVACEKRKIVDCRMQLVRKEGDSLNSSPLFLCSGYSLFIHTFFVVDAYLHVCLCVCVYMNDLLCCPHTTFIGTIHTRGVLHIGPLSCEKEAVVKRPGVLLPVCVCVCVYKSLCTNMYVCPCSPSHSIVKHTHTHTHTYPHLFPLA